jgi:hypothetical protein
VNRYVHISQLDTNTPGAPWCNEPGLVVVTDDPNEVTCHDCLEHVRRCALHWRQPPIVQEAPPIHHGSLVAGLVGVLGALRRL